jgi:hypothetical protein
MIIVGLCTRVPTPDDLEPVREPLTSYERRAPRNL